MVMQWVRLAADGQAYIHPCLLWCVHLKGTAGATCTATLYDGFSTSGLVLLTLVSTAEGAYTLALPRPIAVRSGLYLDLGAAAAEAAVGFEPLPEA